MERRCKLLGWVGLIAAMILAPFVLWTLVRAGEARSLSCEQSVYDFGTVDADTIIEHEFVLRNVGKAKLTGLWAMPGCGRISTTLSCRAIDPGATARACVHLEVRTLRGAVEMKVFVSGDGSARPVTLILRGVVKEQ